MGRTQKSIKNIAFGIGAQSVTTLIHFLTKSLIARLLGAQIVAMNGLFQEVVTCLSLAELGIGSAIVFNLYKPLAEDDKEKVSQLMTFFKQAYRVIAFAVLGIGTLACFFVQYIVKDIIHYCNDYIRKTMGCEYILNQKICYDNIFEMLYLMSNKNYWDNNYICEY